MRKELQDKIMSDVFLESFLNEMSSDVIPYRAAQPDYTKHRAESTEWNNIVVRLDRHLYDEYEDVLGEAFGDYEVVNETYFWTLGLKDTVNGQIRSCDEVKRQTDIPGLAEAEEQLDLACQHFMEQLDVELRQKCSDYLKIRKELVATGRYCYYCHGIEFTTALLEKAGCAPDSDSGK